MAAGAAIYTTIGATSVAGLVGAADGLVGLLALIPEVAAPELAGWVEPEVELWVAVVERAISDACSQAAGPVRAGARRWLTEPSYGLHQILLLIDIESSWWHRQAVPLLRLRWEAPGRARGARWTAIPFPAAP